MATNDAEKTTVNTIDISDLTSHADNANRGTARGQKLMKESIRKNALGRSILLDKNNVIIAGNKTASEAESQGYKKVVVVDTDGETLIAVRRTDLDVKDKKAQELAIADNRVGEVDLSWDTEVLKLTQVDLTQFFDPLELDRLLEGGKNSRQPNTIDLQQPPKMMWVLLGIPINRFDLVQENLAALERQAEISVQSARN